MSSHEAQVQPTAATSSLRADGAVPLASAVAALLCLTRVGLNADGLIAAFVGFILVWLAAIDLRERILPNRIVLPATGFVLAAHVALEPSHAFRSLLSAVAAGAIFLVPALIRPDALGMGDVKLAMLLGAALGGQVVPALALGLLLAGLFAAGLVFTRGRTALRIQMPLGPFLVLGGLVVLLA